MDWSFFAFPINLLLAVLWIVCWGWLWKNRPQSAAVRFILSPAATISAIIMLVAVCMWIGFSGDSDIAESVLSVLVLLYVQTVLLLVTFRGWRRPDGVVRWRFLLLHAGLLLALGSGFWGAPDSCELRLAMEPLEKSDRAFRSDGSVTGLGYELQLTALSVETDDAGVPLHYEAQVSVDGAAPASITVNDPYSVGFGKDIYLVSVNKDKNYCILQIVREPWRYFALAGIVMLIAGAFMLFIKGPRK